MMFNKALNPIGGPGGAIRLHVGFNRFAQGFEYDLPLEPVRGARRRRERVVRRDGEHPQDGVHGGHGVDAAKENWDNNGGFDYLLVEGGEGNATTETGTLGSGASCTSRSASGRRSARRRQEAPQGARGGDQGGAAGDSAAAAAHHHVRARTPRLAGGHDHVPPQNTNLGSETYAYRRVQPVDARRRRFPRR